MESKKYITSKSKTFKEGSEALIISKWMLDSLFDGHWPLRTKQKVKITITNLK